VSDRIAVRSGHVRAASGDHPDWRDDEHALAYIVLAQARAACEGARETASRREELEALRDIHRDLGLAGYLVSHELDPELRHELWEIVAAQGPVAIPAARDEHQHLLMLTAHSRVILLRCLGDPPRSDHIRSACRACSNAMARLMRVVGMTRSSALISRASGDGRFERDWQRARLAP
jgi:hypothetical protein